MLVRRLRKLAPAIALLLLPLTSVPALADQDVTVRMVDFRFEPSSLNVRAGEKVRFMLVNAAERFPHDLHVEGRGIVAEAVEGAGNVPAGQSITWEYTFANAGTYEIWCPVGSHRDQGMTGTLTVAAAGAQPGQLPRTGDASIPLGGLALAAGALLLGAGWKLRRARQGVSSSV